MKTKLNLKKSLTAITLLLTVWLPALAQSTPSSGNAAYIQSVHFGSTINGMSGGSNTSTPGYSDWTSVVLHAEEGATNSISLQFGGAVTSSNIYNSVRIWIDYNNNANFESGEELLFQQYIYFSTISLCGNYGSMANKMSDFISIPAGTAGVHLMRIRYMDTMTGFSSCQNYTGNGETEDYKIQIDPQACVAANPNLNSQGFEDAGVNVSVTTTMANQPISASIDFFGYNFTCGYIQWYYTIGNTYPLLFIEIPNSNSTSITYTPTVSGEFRLWATGMMGCPQKFMLARGNIFFVDPDTTANTSSSVHPHIQKGPEGKILPETTIAHVVINGQTNESSTHRDQNTYVQEKIFSLGNASIYPNPCADKLHVDFINFPVPSVMTLIDSQGNLISTRTLSEGAEEVILSTEGLAKGIYFVSIRNAENTITQQVVKL